MAHAMSRELTNAEVAVFAAIQRGDYGDVCAFLKKLGNVNIADPAKKTSEYTYTLVHATLEAFCTGRHAIENYLKLGKDAKTTQVQALCKTQLEILDLVLRTRFDAMQVCSQDATTLPTLTMRWVEPPHTVAFFKVLMHRDHTHSGIKPNMCDLVPGQPCVFEAVQRRNFEAATFFFAHGIEVTTMNEDGECLLYNAVMRRDLLAVEFLLRQTDINVNQVTLGSRETPLLAAVRMNAVEIVEVLIDSGADLSLSDQDNNTPLTIAVKREYHAILPLLRNRNIVIINKHQVLGSGAVGTVYRGTFNGRNVAVKVFQQVFDPSIWTEIRFLSSLASEFIVKLLHVDIKPTESWVAFVLELMAMNLRQRLGQDAKLVLVAKVRIALDVIRGVDYLHKKKIVYCDLKSENVLVSDDGHAKLADFGISQQSTRRGDANQQGTPQYMAPELTGSAAAAPTYASDVYAFGILLTELDANTGMVPYETIDYNNNHFALWKEVRSGLRPALRDDCPLWFRELAVQCMATVPSDRPSVSTIIDILDKNLRDM